MNENHQDKKESKTPATEDKSPLSPLSSQDQRGLNQPQNDQMEGIIKHLSDRGYRVTEEYNNIAQLSRVSGERPQRKTWWDWLQLIIIPLVLIAVSFGLGLEQSYINDLNNTRQQMRDQQAALELQRETRLETYLRGMSDLLLIDHLRESKFGDPVRDVARAQTLTTLQNLDPNRKGVILRFLYEARLIGATINTSTIVQGQLVTKTVKIPQIIDLTDANLNGVILTFINLNGIDLHLAWLQGAELSFDQLVGANLFQARMSGAKLNQSNLDHANLSYAYLAKVDLSGATLTNANLSQSTFTNANLSECGQYSVTKTGADLTGARLTMATLDGADLHKAIITKAQLIEAKSYNGAILPDAESHTCPRLTNPPI